MTPRIPQKLLILLILSVFLGLAAFLNRGLLCNDLCQTKRVMNVLDRCSDQTNRTDFIVCLEGKMNPIMEQTSPQFVNQTLVELYRQQPDILLDKGIYGCHDISHAMGHLSYDHSDSLTAAYQSCLPVCAYGCYHGVTEQMVASNGTLSDLTTATCEGAGDTARRPCYHGVGHGVASIVADPQSSLEYCSLFPEDDYGPELCAYGVFMELFLPSLTNHEALTIPDDLVGFCQELEGDYTGICLSLAGAHEFLRTGSFDQGVNICQQVPDEDQDYCFVGLGQEVYAASKGEVSILLNHYLGLEVPARQSFLKGVVEATTWENPFSPNGEAFCQQVAVEDQELCWQELESFL